MYDHRTDIDNQLYNNVCDLLSSRSKFVIYDLTNIYFEGQMLGVKMLISDVYFFNEALVNM